MMLIIKHLMRKKAQDKVNNHQSTDDNFKDKAESQINDKKIAFLIKVKI